jgi:hypothetical protein
MAGTCTVACRLPHGLILRVFDMVTRQEPMMGGGYREVPFANPHAERVIINGYAAPFGQSPAAPMASGYALTHGVDAEFFARWMKENEHSDLVRNKLIFAFAKDADVVSAAKENEKRRNGLEPLDPDNPPAEFRRIEKATPGIR